MTNITPLVIVGATDAASCEGDFCEIPEQQEQAKVNLAVDADNI